MHSRGYAHMDIKPHNVLIQRPARQQQQQQGPGSASMLRMGARAQGRLAAAADNDNDGGDLEAGTSLVSMARFGGCCIMRFLKLLLTSMQLVMSSNATYAAMS